MTHRHGCDMPAPTRTLTRLSDGIRVVILRCPACGATALQREDTR